MFKYYVFNPYKRIFFGTNDERVMKECCSYGDFYGIDVENNAAINSDLESYKVEEVRMFQ